MAPRRLTKRGPSPCPACDASLEPGLAGEAEPRCPACGVMLEPVEVAGFWRRAAAIALDGLILSATAVPLNLLLLVLVAPPPIIDARTPMGMVLELAAAPVASLFGRVAPALGISYLYFVLFWSTSGSTPGSRALGLRVVSGDGERVGVAAAALRGLVYGLGLIPGALGSVWIAFDLHKRAWHDKAADSYVIRTTRRIAA